LGLGREQVAKHAPAAAREPLSTLALIDQGRVAARQGDLRRAREQLFEAIERDPRSEEAWLSMAAVCEQPQEALGCLRIALDINPHNERARAGLEAIASSLKSVTSTEPLERSASGA